MPPVRGRGGPCVRSSPRGSLCAHAADGLPRTSMATFHASEGGLSVLKILHAAGKARWVCLQLVFCLMT